MFMSMLNPVLLCRQHLLGEHGEIHKFRESFVKKISMLGRLSQIEPKEMKIRHDLLVEEMLNRNYNHFSPYILPDISYLDSYIFKVDITESIRKLYLRCSKCRKRFETFNIRIEI